MASETIERTGYRYVPGPFQYSSGVAALPGFAVRRARFARPVPVEQGFARIAEILRAEGQPLTALCACELRSPGQFSDAGFTAFNRVYVGTLEKWGIFLNDSNPVARSNVCPEIDPPDEPGFHAFCYVAPGTAPGPSFVIAGSGEAQEGGGSYRERTVRYGDVSAEAMTEKARFVLGQMERRMAALGVGWAETTETQVYTVYDIHPFFGPEIVARGAGRHGIVWHFCRPPVQGLEFEVDCRGVHSEQVLSD